MLNTMLSTKNELFHLRDKHILKLVLVIQTKGVKTLYLHTTDFFFFKYQLLVSFYEGFNLK